jgi:hypothetical protein
VGPPLRLEGVSGSAQALGVDRVEVGGELAEQPALLRQW